MKDRNERSRKHVVAAIGGQYAGSIDLDTVQEFLPQLIACVDTETAEIQERRLGHREEAEKFYRDLAARGGRCTWARKASGHARWFERLLAEMNSQL